MSKLNDSLKLLTDAALALNKATKAANKAKEGQQGSYSMAVQAAVVAGDAGTLDKAFTELFSRIRTDGTFAVQCGADKIAKPKPGGPRYKIPSGLMSAKSVTLGAYKHGVDFTEDREVRSFGAIRTDLRAAQQAEKAANLTGDDKTRVELVEMLNSIRDSVSDFGGKGLAELYASVTDIHNAVNAVQEQAAEANAEPAPIAEAA